jgi:hypothetical protein
MGLGQVCIEVDEYQISSCSDKGDGEGAGAADETTTNNSNFHDNSSPLIDSFTGNEAIDNIRPSLSNFFRILPGRRG